MDIVFPGQTPSGVLGQDLLPSNFDLVLYRGDYFSLNVTLTDATSAPINLTGYTAKSCIKSGYAASSEFDATCTIATPTNGVVNITFPSAVTETITAGSYIWDFQLTDPSGNVRTYLTGDVTVYDEVTR
jgi:hypothetical protein